MHSMRDTVESFYEKKFKGHRGYWSDKYPRSLRVYSESLYGRRNEHILRELHARLSSSQSILDAGCGVGDILEKSATRYKRCVGLDYSFSNLKHASENLRSSKLEPIELVCASCQQLPFAAGTFNLVLMADVIEHIPDIDAALAEIHRVLAPGGIFFCITPRPKIQQLFVFLDSLFGIPRRVLKLMLGRSTKPADQPIFERFVGPRELQYAFKKRGFNTLNYRSICFYPGPEGGGALSWLCSTTHRVLGAKAAEFINQLLISLFRSLEKLGVLNQKQFWIVERR